MTSWVGRRLVRRRARPAGLDRARRAAAVARSGVAVVALPPRELEAVAADGGARAARALRLDGAGRRAAVVRDEVAVVALLEALLAPSPHFVAWQTDWGSPPASCRRSRARACRSRCSRRPTVLLPSSHCSLPATMPSPHCLAMHFAPGVGHCQPVSTGTSTSSRRPRRRCRRRTSRRRRPCRRRMDVGDARLARGRAGVVRLELGRSPCSRRPRRCCRRRTARRGLTTPSPQTIGRATDPHARAGREQHARRRS